MRKVAREFLRSMLHYVEGRGSLNFLSVKIVIGGIMYPD